MQTDKRSMCAANSRRSSESLTLSALFGGTDHWPKPEIDGNEEEITFRLTNGDLMRSGHLQTFFSGSLSSLSLSLSLALFDLLL